MVFVLAAIFEYAVILYLKRSMTKYFISKFQISDIITNLILHFRKEKLRKNSGNDENFTSLDDNEDNDLISTVEVNFFLE